MQPRLHCISLSYDVIFSMCPIHLMYHGATTAPTKNGPGGQKCGRTTPTRSGYSESRHYCCVIAKLSAKNRASGAKLPPPVLWKTCLWKPVGLGNFWGDPQPKTVQKRINAVQLPDQGLIIREVDTFAVIMPNKAPKTGPVAPSYPPGTLENLLLETSRVRQFLGGRPTKNGPGAQGFGRTIPNWSCYSRSRHFCGAKGKKSVKNRAGSAKLPPLGVWETCFLHHAWYQNTQTP